MKQLKLSVVVLEDDNADFIVDAINEVLNDLVDSGWLADPDDNAWRWERTD